MKSAITLNLLLFYCLIMRDVGEYLYYISDQFFAQYYLLANEQFAHSTLRMHLTPYRRQ
jgi:hypothetical protein